MKALSAIGTVGALQGSKVKRGKMFRMNPALAGLVKCRRLAILVLALVAALLFAGAPQLWAHSASFDDPFLFSSFGPGSYQEITHIDDSPWKGFVTLTATNTGTENWTDFHFGIFSVFGSDISRVYFQGGTPTMTVGGNPVPLTWVVNNNNPSGATLDLFFFNNPVLPSQSATFTVYTDNTADRVNFGMLFYPTVTPIPIPGAVWLLGSGLAGLISLRRRLRG